MKEPTSQLFPYLFSWPVASVLVVLFLRKPIMKIVERLINGKTGKAKIGPVEVELGQLADDGKKAVQQLNDINQLIAKSRLLELEITMTSLSPAFSETQQKQLAEITHELKEKLRELDEDKSKELS